MIKTFELKFVLKFVVIALAGVCIQALALYLTFPKSEVKQYGEAIEMFANAETILRGAITSAFIIESIILPVLVTFVAVFASHKIAGPIYRVQKSLEEPVATKIIRPIKLRSYDQLQDTARSFNSMIAGVSEHFSGIRRAQEELDQATKNLDDKPGSAEQLREKVDNLGKAIEKFRLS